MTNQSISKSIKEQILTIITKHISNDHLEVILFGSFAQGLARPTSDIDLCLKADRPIDYYKILAIKSELEESNIPYKIDIVDFNHLDQSFKEIALKEVVKWL